MKRKSGRSMSCVFIVQMHGVRLKDVREMPSDRYLSHSPGSLLRNAIEFENSSLIIETEFGVKSMSTCVKA